jgi:hypothetical protein
MNVIIKLLETFSPYKLTTNFKNSSTWKCFHGESSLTLFYSFQKNAQRITWHKITFLRIALSHLLLITKQQMRLPLHSKPIAA